MINGEVFYGRHTALHHKASIKQSIGKASKKKTHTAKSYWDIPEKFVVLPFHEKHLGLRNIAFLLLFNISNYWFSKVYTQINH